jgi:phosphoribosylaminoimidazole (AIR) synthetase
MFGNEFKTNNLINTQTLKAMNTKIQKIEANKELQKQILKMTHYNSEQFLKDSEQYVKAIKERRMICNIISVSNSGMSRNIKFLSCEKSKHDKSFWYSNYFSFFKALGHTESKEGFRINGCGMDMIFHTNYCIIHNLKSIGLINQKECTLLAQMTPTVM